MNGKKVKQTAINLTSGGVCTTICAGIYKSSISNTIPVADNQHYTAFIVIYAKADTNKST